MSWFRVDDKSHSHAKVEAAGNEAWGAFGRMGSWSADHLTDGFIPEATALRFAGKKSVLTKLMTTVAGFEHPLLERVEGGYQMHDYLDWNMSAEKVQKERDAWAERQRLSRESRKPSRRDKPSDDDPMSRRDTPGESRPGHTRPDPIPDPDLKKQTKGDEPAVKLEGGYEPGTSQPIPPDLPLTSEARASAEMAGVRDVEACWREFVLHYQSTGDMFSNWYARWGWYIGNARKRQEIDRSRELRAAPPVKASRPPEAAVYEAAVEDVTGHPFVVSTKHEGDLLRAVDGHARDAETGEPLVDDVRLEWLTDHVTLFARWLFGQTSEVQKFHAAGGPAGFLRWLNERRSHAA